MQTFVERAWENLHGYTRKGSRDLWDASYSLAKCNFCGVGVVELKAGSDTFPANCLERNGGIYWLCHADLGA